jgi:hypothetical protein
MHLSFRTFSISHVPNALSNEILDRGTKISDFWFHDLRHTFASWYMMNGGGLYELAKILGHSNIKMTERYAKLARHYIARTGSTAREMWTLLRATDAEAKTGSRCAGSGEADHRFRQEADQHSGRTRSAVGAKRRWAPDCAGSDRHRQGEQWKKGRVYSCQL